MMLRAAALAAAVLVATPANARPPCEKAPCPSAWTAVTPQQRQEIFRLAEDFKAFMALARTQNTTVREVVRRAEAAGFRRWRPGSKPAPGSRWYDDNRGRPVTLFVVGRRPMASGFRIAAAHLDSNYLELKARPVYAAEGFALLQTNIHGNILNHQWGNTPLALVGRAVRRDGTPVEISVGLAADDPVFMIAGLSPHVDADLRERKNRDVLLAEELDPIVGTTWPAGSDAAEAIRAHLQRAYGLAPDDLTTAELALVPAMAPRDVGFDRAMMAMYGQDDRFGAYAALRAILELKAPEQTAVVYLADNEETGNVNSGGAASDYLVNLLTELLDAEAGASWRETTRGRAFAASRVLSIDVNDAINPTWPSAWEPGNAPRVGHGVNLKVYGKGGNATPEYGAWMRRVLDDAGVWWQTATYKVGRASGGTLGGELSLRNMDVIDLGAPVLSVHNTYEISSKVDLWSLCRAGSAFFAAP